jgi:hypothetical protein
METDFQKLIREHEEDLERIRALLFPLIHDRIITGYNIYPSSLKRADGLFFLNYLHSDLRKEDKHYQELGDMLVKQGIAEERINIYDQLIDRQEVAERNADYVTLPDWQDPAGMRYFDFDGNEIPPEIAKRLERELIGEGMQLELLIRLKDEEELRKATCMFRRYASEFKLDRYGRKIGTNNPESIAGAWEVPLVVCTTSTNKKPRFLVDFLRVNEFSFYEKLGGEDVFVSTLVRRKTRELRNALKKLGVDIDSRKKYVMRLFVEKYIDK